MVEHKLQPTLADRLEKALPLLVDLTTGQDCEEYAVANGRGFQAMTHCPEAFEALRCIPEVIDALEAISAENAKLAAELDRAAEARDAAGYICRVHECITELASENAGLRTELAALKEPRA